MPEGCVSLMMSLLAVMVALTTTPGLCHVLWTPILPASQDQVDLWTVSGTGCPCPGGQPPRTGGPHDCACCVSRVACPCGQANPHRCAQCGLQQHCSNMCNMTINGRLLSVTSGRLSGSLVSPGELEAPTSCWYRLTAPPAHRVEVQIHRLVHVGSFINATTCRGGFVEVSAGPEEGGGGGGGGLPPQPALRLCGEDERLHPPLVLYSDSGSATITYRVKERWGSPRFIAYYNFPHKSDPDTGDRQRGGTRLDYTACDWLYQDVHCSVAGECQLTSPGFPGVYPGQVRCKYLLVMSSPDTAGTLTFHTMDLHPERCSTDFLAVFAGTSTSTPLIDSLCASDARTIHFSGPSVLLDFSSGPHQPPYRFSGFHATVDFTGVVGVPLHSSPHSPPVTQPRPNTLSDPTEGTGEGECHKVIWSNMTREGIFDTSAICPGGHTCCLRLMGRQDEVVQMSLFKYKLGGRACTSEASIYDGVAAETGDTLLRRLCGPLSREARDAAGRFLQQQLFLSSGTKMEIHLNLGPSTNFLNQFLVGGYHFHNSRLEGTKKPTSVCDVMFYGASSPRQGLLPQPTSTLLWNMDGPLNCSYLFVPTSTQSLSLTVREGSVTATEGHCSSQCGQEGCQCRPSMVPLQHVDYLLFLHTKTRQVIACLCGRMKDMRPLLVETGGGGGVDVIYHVAHFTWTTPGFNFTLAYSFYPASVCGPTYHTALAGEVGPGGYTTPATTYLYVTCTWVISSQPASALAITVTPPKQGSCTTWNLTVWSMGRETGPAWLGAACGSHHTLLLHVPVDHLSASLTLEMRGARRPDWLISWNSHWPHHLPPSTSISPKPEHSRTVNAHPTRKTHKVQSDGWTFRKSVSGWRHRLLQAVLALLLATLTSPATAGLPVSPLGLPIM